LEEKSKEKRAYSITTQKSKVFGIFDDKKVKNIDSRGDGHRSLVTPERVLSEYNKDLI